MLPDAVKHWGAYFFLLTCRNGFIPAVRFSTVPKHGTTGRDTTYSSCRIGCRLFCG